MYCRTSNAASIAAVLFSIVASPLRLRREFGLECEEALTFIFDPSRVEQTD